jgi:ribosome biogenesis GTPase
MRERQLWAVGESASDATVADIAALAARCRFGDCTHHVEPGCAVQAALDDGSLEGERWRSFQKLRREQAYAARQAGPRLARESKAGGKKIHQTKRVHYRLKRGD